MRPGRALDQHLHPEIRHVPAGIAQRVGQQLRQVGVDRVVQADLLPHEPREQLDVPRFVHGLGGGVELGVHVRHGLHDPGCHGERALLAVQELAEQPRGQVLADFRPLLLGQHIPLT